MLAQQNNDLDSKICEIIKLKDLMEEIGRRLQTQPDFCDSATTIYSCESSTSNLSSLFSVMQKFCFILEQAKETLCNASKLEDDNEKLRDKINCLEKCVSTRVRYNERN